MWIPEENDDVERVLKVASLGENDRRQWRITIDDLHDGSTREKKNMKLAINIITDLIFWRDMARSSKQFTEYIYIYIYTV